MFPFKALAALATLAVVSAQQVGTNTAEVHPKISSQTCTKTGGCTTQQTSVVLDSNWRWLHTTTGYTNCYTGNTWDATLCPDDKTCAANCALDGADYSGTYGITTSGNALTLKFVTGKNIGSRVYLLDTSDSKYQLFKLLNQEFTFDVDMSNLGCGLNGALYLSQMDADGGLAKYPTNKAGAKYGTGYCDAQCPHDMKFINGEANVEGWTPSTSDVNAGSGKYGTCCTEMDIWEANFNAAAYTPHPCSVNGQTRCSGVDCGDDSANQRYQGVCDKDGCDFNSYRQGDTSFLGQGKTIDTNKKFTVVTQFITSDGTSTGALSEIRRIYVQDGKVYQNSQSLIPGVPGNSITDSFCAAQKSVFGDQNMFKAKGGIAAMSSALKAGMVLSMSVWDDHAANMLWLDSTYPVDKTGYGGPRGPCATTSGVPKDVEANQGSSSVTFSNIRFGDIGSTYTGTGTTPSSSSASSSSSSTTKPSSTSSSSSTSKTTSSTATPSPTGTAAHYAQCGGIGYTGPTVCASPYTCQSSGPYYSQCL